MRRGEGEEGKEGGKKRNRGMEGKKRGRSASEVYLLVDSQSSISLYINLKSLT